MDTNFHKNRKKIFLSPDDYPLEENDKIIKSSLKKNNIGLVSTLVRTHIHVLAVLFSSKYK